MPTELLIDPAWLRSDVSCSGRYDIPLNLASRSSVEDVYFEEPAADTPESLALDRLLESLPPRLGRAVRLQVLESLSYREIAVEMGWFCGRPPYPNKKRAWRAVRDGLAAMRHRIATDDDLQFLDPEEGP